MAGTKSKLLRHTSLTDSFFTPKLLRCWHPHPHPCPYPVLLWARGLGLRGAGARGVTLTPSSCPQWHTRPDLLRAVRQTVHCRRGQGRSGGWTEGPWPNAGPSS